MQVDVDDPAAESALTSPPPAQREHSFTATAAEKMRSKRSSSRISHSTPSKHGDDDSSKTAVKVGTFQVKLDRNVCASIADLARRQLFEYDHLLSPRIRATTSSRNDSAKAHAKFHQT